MKTICLDRYGVRSRLSDNVLDALDLANDFRRDHCAIQQVRHEAMVNLRNELFPSLIASLERFERAKCRIYEIERRIKELHSEKRDRNAVTKQLAAELQAARKERATAKALVAEERKPWYATERAFKVAFRELADWKNVKSLAKRRELYQSFVADSVPSDLPTNVEAMQRYAALWMDWDLRERVCSAEYQARGLHWSIRQEIVAASAPKLSRTGPGMRYRYGVEPEVRPWSRLTIQFAGGWSLGKSSRKDFRLTRIRGNLWHVTQQIGTSAESRIVEYEINVHRPFPSDMVIQRWTLDVQKEMVLWRSRNGDCRYVERLRATAQPVARTAGRDKPIGSGTLHYRLGSEIVAGGVRVAKFWGEHVNESIIVPASVIAPLMSLASAQQAADSAANDFLLSRGVAVNGRLTGYPLLRSYISDQPGDVAAQAWRDSLALSLYRAAREQQRAQRRLVDIYRVVANRVCSLHADIHHDATDLSKAKRYATRNLLQRDEREQYERTIAFLCAPGKLRLAIKNHGLPAASGDVAPEPPAGSRETDVVASYVASLAPSQTASKWRNRRRSQIASQS